MKKPIELFSDQEKKKSDLLMDYFLSVFFMTGILLSLFYDTWFIAIGTGGVSLIAYYFAKFIFRNSNFYQYVLGAAMGIFVAQFVYQMHGMFEMYFFAFISSAILITYRNWKLQIPLAIVLFIHYVSFWYLQSSGFEKVYFTQMDNVTTQAFLLHGVLTLAILSLCGLWSYNFKRSVENLNSQSYEIGKLQEVYNQKLTLLAMSEDLKASNKRLSNANYELVKIFNTIEEVLFSIDLVNFHVIEMSVACLKVYGYAPIEFIADSKLWFKVIHPDDKYIIEGNDQKLGEGRTVTNQYRIIHKNKDIRWIEAKIVPTLDQSGNLIRIDGVNTDITEKVMLEKKLAHAKKQKNRLITTAVLTAQENERYFLGEELHDNINPILATAKLYIECAISGNDKQVSLLQESKSFITTAMSEIRILSKSLIPPSLREIDLVDAIAEMIGNISRVHELKFITNWNGLNESLLNDNLKITIYRILQEQLNNILKHANAKTVVIVLEQVGSELKLQIKDDGIGFDMELKRTGVGLQNIISRTELFNGSALIKSEPGMGCELILNFNMEIEMPAVKTGLRA